MRIVAIMHLADLSGPAVDLRHWLTPLARTGSLEVLVPGQGAAAALFGPVASVGVARYQPLTFPSGLAGLARSTRLFARDVRLFRRALRRARPDVVVIATAVLPAALVAAWLERVPRITYVAEIFDKGFVRSPARSLSGTAVRLLTGGLSSALVCCSRTVEAQFGAARGKTTTIYPGVTSEYAAGDRESARRRLGLAGANPCLVVVGNLTPGRGQDVVLCALPLVREVFPDVHCVIAGLPHPRPGDIAYARGLERLAGELGVGDAVSLPGIVDPVADLLAAADVVVNPARFAEPFGRVAIEAQMAGRPVIASRVGAIPEVLTDGHDALLVEPDCPEALAGAIVRLWREPELRDRLVRNGRERARRDFAVETSVRSFARVVAAVGAEDAPFRAHPRDGAG